MRLAKNVADSSCGALLGAFHRIAGRYHACKGYFRESAENMGYITA